MGIIWGMKRKSPEIRAAAVHAVLEGKLSIADALSVFHVSKSSLYLWIKIYRDEGRIVHKTPPGRPSVLNQKHESLIRDIMDKQPDITLAELADRMGNIASIATLHNYLKKHGYGYKKKTLKASEQDREDVKTAREAWRDMQKKLSMHRIVCLDESAAKTNMTRLYGRALNGQRCYDSAPDSRWKTTTVLSSLRTDAHTACMIYEGGTSLAVFETYVAEVLCPSLRPGDVVIMDNLSSHKSPQITKMITDCGAALNYLPVYSPDLNPIEKMWSKMKAILRKLKARTQEELDAAIKIALDAVTPQDAVAWFTSCGYQS